MVRIEQDVSRNQGTERNGEKASRDGTKRKTGIKERNGNQESSDGTEHRNLGTERNEKQESKNGTELHFQVSFETNREGICILIDSISWLNICLFLMALDLRPTVKTEE